MNKVILIFMMLFSATYASSQSLDSLYSNQKIAVEYRNSYAHQEYVAYTSNIQGEPRRILGISQVNFPFNTINFSFNYQTNRRGGIYLNYYNQSVGDLIARGYYEMMVGDYDKVELIRDWAFGNSYFGELNIGSTVYVSANKRFNVSTGLLLSDISIKEDFYDVGGKHLAVGGFVNLDKMIFNKYVLRVSGYYGESAFYLDGNNPDFRKPFNYRTAVEIINSNGWYAGIDVRGIYYSSRSTINLGYRFSCKQVKENMN